MCDLSLQFRNSLAMSNGLSCPTTCGILVPWLGIEPASPALQGRFLTSGPPGKFIHTVYFGNLSSYYPILQHQTKEQKTCRSRFLFLKDVQSPLQGKEDNTFGSVLFLTISGPDSHLPGWAEGESLHSPRALTHLLSLSYWWWLLRPGLFSDSLPCDSVSPQVHQKSSAFYPESLPSAQRHKPEAKGSDAPGAALHPRRQTAVGSRFSPGFLSILCVQKPMGGNGPQRFLLLRSSVSHSMGV